MSDALLALLALSVFIIVILGLYIYSLKVSGANEDLNDKQSDSARYVVPERTVYIEYRRPIGDRKYKFSLRNMKGKIICRY